MIHFTGFRCVKGYRTRVIHMITGNIFLEHAEIFQKAVQSLALIFKDVVLINGLRKFNILGYLIKTTKHWFDLIM